MAKFITFEGIDGAGKSTHLIWFAKVLRESLQLQQRSLIVTREPGGTKLGEELRAFLLQNRLSSEAETLLFFAARKEHLVQIIEPALLANTWVLSDRFTDATFAYQGGGYGLNYEQLSLLEAFVQKNLQPDITVLFDIDVDLASKRLSKARSLDKFESESRNFFIRVRQAYLNRALANLERFIIINAEKSIASIREELICTLLPRSLT